MSHLFISITRIILMIIVVSGLLLSVSADCGCKNRDFPTTSEPVPPISTPEIPSISDQRQGILSAGDQSPANTSRDERNQSPVSDFSELANHSVQPGFYQITSDTGSADTRCRPAGTVPDVSSSADSWSSPIITSLYPSSVIAGSNSFTLTVDGNYFIPETRVMWDARDYTKSYYSTHQMTAEIPASETGTPGLHYISVINPEPCGGNSNISLFQVRDTGQSFPLSPYPRRIEVMKGELKQGSITVQSLSKGLLRYNLTLIKENQSPFSFAFSGFPSWVSNPRVTWIDTNQMQITGEDTSDQIRNGTGEEILVNFSVIGTGTGTGYLSCILNEATADDGTSYGSGYTALPVTVGDIQPFPDPSGGDYQAPTDINADGQYEDINGNKRLDFNDVVIYFYNTDFIITRQPWWVFDYDQNGIINLNDVVHLFRETL